MYFYYLVGFLTLSLKHAICSLFVYAFDEVELSSQRFYNELQRHVYISPVSLIDVAQFFLHLLDKKEAEIKKQLFRLQNGLKTIDKVIHIYICCEL